jgi:hypothetical protein
MDINNRLAQANGRLKASNTGISIEKRGGTLWLRGTLPPKPNSGKTKPYQQKLSLRTKENTLEIVSYTPGNEYDEKLEIYRKLGVLYYIIRTYATGTLRSPPSSTGILSKQFMKLAFPALPYLVG